MSRRFFIDTSALIKLYHEESGTERLTRLIISETPIIVISDLTIIEMVSALAKKVRTREIDEHIFNEAVLNFENDVSAFEVTDINENIKRYASYLLKTVGMQRGLKSLDSLQLASALAAPETPELFIAADNLLGEIAELQGLDVMII
ncbi:MAG: hypothetical protein DRI57_17425 [Deltaproteobacteria bacterium]|nr:MAG: hypothetical protein DRI57_17425 [Deltaproteobacteria bacterium]